MSVSLPSQTEFLYRGERSIWLPELSVKRRVSAGEITQQLVPAGKHDVDRTESPPAGFSQALFLRDGTSILTTSRKKYIDQAGWDSVLALTSPARWLRHKLQDRVEQSWEHKRRDHLRSIARASWEGGFMFRQQSNSADEDAEPNGLRAPQIGALHAIGAHWTVGSEPATIVMPTGTGKTETMLGILIAYRPTCLLVVVPTDALRTQTANKFRTLGILRRTGNVAPTAVAPVVGLLRNRPRSVEELEIFDRSNVVVATAASVAQSTAGELLPEIVARCSHLIFDEAHHVPAASWSVLKNGFAGKPILQFTATPYREDGKPVEGKVIYNYSLRQALRDGFFKRIHFRSVFKANQEDADLAIARAAVRQLKEDLKAKFDHLLMARCKDTKRAAAVFDLYQRLAPELNPVLIHSALSKVSGSVKRLQDGDSKIAVCVNMLAEGFDLPQLKIAAVHDKHKSLTPLLQFVGRFSRTSGSKLGDATFIANTADSEKSDVLERIYDDDPGWIEMLADVSFEVAEQESKLRELVRESKALHEAPTDGRPDNVALTTIFPKHSAVVYEATRFTPEGFKDALPTGAAVTHAWLIKKERLLVLVTRRRERVEWSSSRALTDDPWTLYIAHYSPERNLLFLHSSDGSDLHRELALAVTGSTAKSLANNEDIFRVFGQINRLLLIQAGLKKRGGLKHRYSMFSGTDIKDALSRLESRNAIRSNFFGHGYQDGKPANIGASAKGKLWSHNSGRLDAFIDWCTRVGSKLRDTSISAEGVFEQAIRPELVYRIPEKLILHAIWPDELFLMQENRVSFLFGGQQICPFSECGISLADVAPDRAGCVFDIFIEDAQTQITMELADKFDEGARFKQTRGEPVAIRIGKREFPLSEYLTSYPPNLLFADGSEMVGCLLYPLPDFTSVFPESQLVRADWTGIDIQVESIWSGGHERRNSVQWRSYEICQNDRFDVIFNDDGANEAADLVCIREEATQILVRLVHCKFASGKKPGARLDDAVVVASQATRCVRWNWNFEKLCDHLRNREARAEAKNRPSRFLAGDLRVLKQIRALSRHRSVAFEIVAAQPGIVKAETTEQQKMILGAADHFIRETAAVGLRIWCS